MGPSPAWASLSASTLRSLPLSFYMYIAVTQGEWQILIYICVFFLDL